MAKENYFIKGEIQALKKGSREAWCFARRREGRRGEERRREGRRWREESGSWRLTRHAGSYVSWLTWQAWPWIRAQRPPPPTKLPLPPMNQAPPPLLFTPPPPFSPPSRLPPSTPSVLLAPSRTPLLSDIPPRSLSRSSEDKWLLCEALFPHADSPVWDRRIHRPPAMRRRWLQDLWE